jgi:hypothetical protein
MPKLFSREILSLIFARILPTSFWAIRRYQMKSLKLQKSFLIISCDCDTQLDTESVLDVDSEFEKLGVSPSYAVPSMRIQSGLEVYRALISKGRDFLNHGYSDHVFFDSEGSAHNSFLYSNLSKLEVCEDFTLGHEYFEKTFGILLKGWRTPHFGSFENRKNLRLIHSLCSRFDYRFSSSSSGLTGFIRGPISVSSQIREFSVTGHGTAGFGVLDSWSFQKVSGEEIVIDVPRFYEAYKNMEENYRGIHSVINLYFDPRHIKNVPEFWEMMKFIVESRECISFIDLNRLLK